MPSVAVSPEAPTATGTDRATDEAVLTRPVTVTLVACAPSPTLDGLTDSVTVSSSSSLMDRLVEATVRPAARPVTLTVSLSSTAVS